MGCGLPKLYQAREPVTLLFPRYKSGKVIVTDRES